MSGNHSRSKGRSGEQELVGLIRDHLGVRMQRRLRQYQTGGWDLEVHPDESGPVAAQLARYAIECKRLARAAPGLLRQHWRQAVRQADASYRRPCLAYRADREGWSFVVPMQLLCRDMPAATADSLDYTCTLTVAGWCALIREGWTV